MTVSGLTSIPSRCCLQIPVHHPRLLGRKASVSSRFKPGQIRQLPHLERQRSNPQQAHLIRCTMGASYGNKEHGSNASSDIFPRINVRDPYKRLGVSREASEYEIQSARNFLVHKYAGHKPSVDAIESAHDKIIMQKFYEKAKPKVDIRKKVREVTQSKVVQGVMNRLWTPSTNFIIKTSIAFLVLGVLTILFPTDEGPTFQVAVSLFTTMYFIHDRLKSKFRAFFYGAVSFIVSWLLATFLMAAMIPPLPIFKGGFRSFEMTTSLITYVFLWMSATYLK